MSRPSVIFFNRVYPSDRGATGRVLRDLARAMARDGWAVTVVTTASVAREDRDGDVRVIRLKSNTKSRNLFTYGAAWVRMMIAGLKLPRPDLIVTMTDPPMMVVAGGIMARVRKTKHIHWCQDLYPDLLPSIGIRLPDFMMSGLSALSFNAMRRCEKIVVIGRCMARQLTKTGLDPKRIAVIPNWPDHELTRTMTERMNDAAVEADASIPARPFEELFRDDGAPKFRVLYAGTIGRAHPIHTIVDAATILQHQCPDIEFVFVGDGPGLDRLAHERARRGLENIRLLPRQPNRRLRPLMESGDVHIISMKHDAAGLLVPSKLYSALAVGRPCVFVGPMNSEVAKVISDFHAGAVVAQGEPETLAQTILTLRMDGNAWHNAHDGSAQAGRIFVPSESINAWIKRARDVVGRPLTPPLAKPKVTVPTPAAQDNAVQSPPSVTIHAAE